MNAIERMPAIIRFIAVPSNMGVVAVYALNEEFKSILRESKNGMISPFSYVLSKTILVLPILFIFGLFALGIPLYVVQDAPKDGLGDQFEVEISRRPDPVGTCGLERYGRDARPLSRHHDAPKASRRGAGC